MSAQRRKEELLIRDGERIVSIEIAEVTSGSTELVEEVTESVAECGDELEVDEHS